MGSKQFKCELELIVQHGYTDPDLSLWHVSATLRISERQLRRLVRLSFGVTFREYLREVRIQHASRLLEVSTDSVKAIAGMVGYNHPSHFAKDFRALMACTPKQFQGRRPLER